MWKNRMKLGFRHLWSEKGYTFINVFGLAIGLGAALAILLYAHFHLSFDNFHSDAARTFRLFTVDKALGVSSSRVGITTPAAGPTAFREIPEVFAQTRYFGQGRQLVRRDELSMYVENYAAVDTNFFTFFDFPLISGDANHVFQGPDDVVITESTARMIFGDEDPMNQTFELAGNGSPVIVKGVCDDPPVNSHLQFDILASTITAPGDTNTAQFFSSWNTIAAPTYIKLQDPERAEIVVDQLLQIARDNNYGENFELATQPLLEAHLESTEILFDNANVGKSDGGQLDNLILVAVFLLVIAAFNFMNLSTARSAKRAREIGMRKVIGASRGELISQFLLEAIVVVLFSALIGIALLRLFEGQLGLDVPNGFTSYFMSNSILWGYLLSLALVLGVLSGLYPAFVLSSFDPIDALKGVQKTSGSGRWMRRVLVTAQFTVSIAVIIGMLVVRSQVNYMQQKDLGFVKDGVVRMQLNSPQLFQNASTYRDMLHQIDGVRGVAFATSLPGAGFGRQSVVPEGYTGDDTWIFSICAGNVDYADVLNFSIADGRWYDEEHTSDAQNSVVINQAAAEALGWSDAVGKQLTVGGSERTVIGVIENFHYVGLRYPIEPLVIMPLGQPGGTLVARIEDRNISEVLADAEAAWSEINPNHPFEYAFFDDDFNQLFTDDVKFASVLTSFNGLAILIACLGLLGLTAYTVQSKTRELGMRKVLGADTAHMVFILSSEFKWLLLISNLIAIPLAYYYMQSWLSEFVFRIELSIWPFVGAVVATVLVAFITIWIQAIRAMKIDPVKALKYE